MNTLLPKSSGSFESVVTHTILFFLRPRYCSVPNIAPSLITLLSNYGASAKFGAVQLHSSTTNITPAPILAFLILRRSLFGFSERVQEGNPR